MAGGVQALCGNAGSDAALAGEKMKRWPVMLFGTVTLLAPAVIGVFTFLNLLSADFREPDCWIGDSGTWMTAHEVLILATIYVVPAFLILGLVLGLGFWRAELISMETFLQIIGAAIAVSLVSVGLNASLNDGYIDRLYAACKRI
jgi:hypothetical protein